MSELDRNKYSNEITVEKKCINKGEIYFEYYHTLQLYMHLA